MNYKYAFIITLLIITNSILHASQTSIEEYNRTASSPWPENITKIVSDQEPSANEATAHRFIISYTDPNQKNYYSEIKRKDGTIIYAGAYSVDKLDYIKMATITTVTFLDDEETKKQFIYIKELIRLADLIRQPKIN